MTNEKLIMRALEAMMFVWGSPLDTLSAAEALDITPEDAKRCFELLAVKYDNVESGLMIREIDGSFQICTRVEYADYIARLCTPVKEKRLSNAALEVLAIVAYKQPISRSVVDRIRGIKSDRIIDGLIKRELIEEKGRGSGIGKPILYGTTKLFLEKLGIKNLQELPDIEAADTASEEDVERRTQQIALEI